MLDRRMRLMKDRALAPIAASLRSVPPVALTEVVQKRRGLTDLSWSWSALFKCSN